MSKNSGWIVLALIFCLMYMFNSLTPLLADDYFSAFVWPEGMGINTLPKDATKIASFSDIMETLKNYYLIWGGRIPGNALIYFFIWQGKEYFNFFNSIAITILVAEIYWLSNEGKVTFRFIPSYLFWIFFALWTFNMCFTETCLWIAGSCNYVWMIVLILAFLLPYVRHFFGLAVWSNDEHAYTNMVFIFFLGLLAGWSHESTNCWIALILSYWLFICKKKGDLQCWQIAGYVGFCLGYCLLVFAPGNFARLHILQMANNTNSVMLTSELLQPKLFELKLVLFFHFVLWCFIFSFFFKYKKYKAQFFYKNSALYVKLSMCFIFIACGSALIIFLIPTNGLRPSFLHQVYLIISVSMLFRVLEKNKISLVSKVSKIFWVSIGCVYLVFTVTFALRGNYLNWCYWNTVLQHVNEVKKQSADVVIEVPAAPTSDNKSRWLLCSGFHMIPITISDDEKLGYNQMFSRYYGIKGIKINPHIK